MASAQQQVTSKFTLRARSLITERNAVFGVGPDRIRAVLVIAEEIARYVGEDRALSAVATAQNFIDLASCQGAAVREWKKLHANGSAPSSPLVEEAMPATISATKAPSATSISTTVPAIHEPMPDKPKPSVKIVFDNARIERYIMGFQNYSTRSAAVQELVELSPQYRDCLYDAKRIILNAVTAYAQDGLMLRQIVRAVIKSKNIGELTTSLNGLES